MYFEAENQWVYNRAFGACYLHGENFNWSRSFACFSTFDMHFSLPSHYSVVDRLLTRNGMQHYVM